MGGGPGLTGAWDMPCLGGRGFKLGTGPFCPGMAGLFTVPGAPGPVASAACTTRRLPRMLVGAIGLFVALLLWADPRKECCRC
jgi:hypothetical protein